jgi:hypothetical protein
MIKQTYNNGFKYKFYPGLDPDFLNFILTERRFLKDGQTNGKKV